MGSHHPFRHLKHTLWPKERSGVKLVVWLPTTKSWESTRFPCVQVAFDIPLEKNSWKGLQLFFQPHYNQRFTRQVMRPQSYKSPKCGNFGTPTWESRDKKPFWMWPSCTKYTIRGKVVASPKSRLWQVLWVRGCLWFILAPKVFKLCINQHVV
jgi:hypothetical protein